MDIQPRQGGFLEEEGLVEAEGGRPDMQGQRGSTTSPLPPFLPALSFLSSFSPGGALQGNSLNTSREDELEGEEPHRVKGKARKHR